jgi:hypothetical protein
MRRVLVCGGRDYADRARAFHELDAMHAEETIRLVIHGACADHEGRLRGADRFAEEWAIAREVPYAGVPARWKLYGRGAGPRRNGEMLMLWSPDAVLALPGGSGTADMVRRAEQFGILVRRVEAVPA